MQNKGKICVVLWEFTFDKFFPECPCGFLFFFFLKLQISESNPNFVQNQFELYIKEKGDRCLKAIAS